MTFKSSVLASAIGSPSKALTGVSNCSAIKSNISQSGTDKPFSHLEGTSKNTMHEPLSTVNGSFFCKKPRNRGTMPTFFAKKSLAHSDKSSHL